jgi:ankyrin repeat protein
MTYIKSMIRINDTHFEQFWQAIASHNVIRQETAIRIFGLNATNSKGESMLIRAAQSLDLIALRFLIGKGADMALRANNGETALFAASKEDDRSAPEAIQILLTAGAGPNDIGEDNYTPLIMTAHYRELLSNMRTLRQGGANVNLHEPKEGIFPLFHAAYGGNIEAMEDLLDNGADIDEVTHGHETALYAAVNQRKIGAARLLLERNAKPNIQATPNGGSQSALDMLICGYRGKKDDDFIELLLQHGAVPGYAVGLAIEKELLSVLKIFHKHRCNWNATCGLEGSKPIHYASRYDKSQIMRWLLNLGVVDPDIENEDGNTSLHLACSFKAEAAFNVLIEHVQHIDRQNKARVTPLYLASQSGSLPMVQKLLQKGANVELQTEDGSTALHIAATEWDLAIELLRNGADPNVQTKMGNTPLHFAAQDGRVRSVDALLRNGANPKLVRADGTTPLFLAHQFGHRECVNLIVRAFYGDNKDIRKIQLLSDVLIPGTDIRIVTFKPKFAEPCEKTNEPTYESPPEKSTMSGTSYLREQGFTDEQINQMRQPAGPEVESKPIVVETLDPAAIKWFGGAIKGDDPNVRYIEGTNKSHNCFLYLAPNCRQEPFTAMVMKFASAVGEQGIKRLKGFAHSFNLHFKGKLYSMRFTDEVKILNSEERLLCCRLLSDDGTTTLLIACHYLPTGLHSKHTQNSLPKLIIL